MLLRWDGVPNQLCDRSFRCLDHFAGLLRLHGRQHLLFERLQLLVAHHLAQGNGLSADIASDTDVFLLLAGLDRGSLLDAVQAFDQGRVDFVLQDLAAVLARSSKLIRLTNADLLAAFS